MLRQGSFFVTLILSVQACTVSISGVSLYQHEIGKFRGEVIWRKMANFQLTFLHSPLALFEGFCSRGNSRAFQI